MCVIKFIYRNANWIRESVYLLRGCKYNRKYYIVVLP